MPEYLTTEEVADRLRVPAATLRFWRMKGIGPRSVKIGPKHVRYAAADVDAYLANAHASA
jgi:excisionase family DNA binding protein